MALLRVYDALLYAAPLHASILPLLLRNIYRYMPPPGWFRLLIDHAVAASRVNNAPSSRGSMDISVYLSADITRSNAAALPDMAHTMTLTLATVASAARTGFSSRAVTRECGATRAQRPSTRRAAPQWDAYLHAARTHWNAPRLLRTHGATLRCAHAHFRAPNIAHMLSPPPLIARL